MPQWLRAAVGAWAGGTVRQASLAGTSKWQKLTEEETGKIEKSLSGTSKLLPSLVDPGLRESAGRGMRTKMPRL
ncbi:unnamed protein product [Durusdinium trenchii]|uniref:Uncharacterized protein n=1 Tax=Durusdinium trenchii TaxID=1381693 RepID=A0ABP0P0I4_9DINO